jgi:hypothetical protein
MNNELDAYINDILNSPEDLKIIMKAHVENDDEKYGVVSIVFISTDHQLIHDKFLELVTTNDNNSFYFLYSCDLNTNLLALDHYPSIRIDKADLS